MCWVMVAKVTDKQLVIIIYTKQLLPSGYRPMLSCKQICVFKAGLGFWKGSFPPKIKDYLKYYSSRRDFTAQIASKSISEDL